MSWSYVGGMSEEMSAWFYTALVCLWWLSSFIDTCLKHKLLCFKTVITLSREGYKSKEAFSEAHWLALCGFKPSHSLQLVFNTRSWPLPWFFHTICGRTVYVLKRIRILHLQILYQYITILHIFPSRSFLLHLKPWMSSVWRLMQAFWSSQRIWFRCINSISASLLKCINRLLIVTLVNHIGKRYCTNERGRTK